MRQLSYIIIACLLVACATDKLEDVELKTNEFENPSLPFVSVDRASAFGEDILVIDVTVHIERLPDSISTEYVVITSPLGGRWVTEKKSNIVITRLPTGTSNYTLGLFQKGTGKISATSSFTYP